MGGEGGWKEDECVLICLPTYDTDAKCAVVYLMDTWDLD